MGRRRKSGISGKSGVNIVIVAILLAIAWNTFHSSSTSNAPVSTQDLDDELDKQTGPKIPWPFLQDNKQNQVADNLLASNIYIVFDASGSMGEGGCSGGEAKILVAKRAVLEFAKSIPGNVNLGLVAFDSSGTRERLPLSPLNNEALESTVGSVSFGGGTPLSAAMRIGYEALTEQGKKQLGYGEYHLLVVTDGRANNVQELNREVHRILKKSPVIIDTIGFCIDENHSLHQPGKTNYSTASDFDSLVQGMRSVLAEAPSFSVSEFSQE